MNPIHQLLYDTVEEIQTIKHDNGQSPDFAAMPEVFNSLHAELLENLRQLCRDGLLECHQTVNGIVMFGIKRANHL